MKRFFSQKQYYILTIITVIIMTSGWLVVIPRYNGLETGLLLHAVLIALLSVSLLIYPKFESVHFRISIIMTGAAYFYMLFFLYPETWSTFIFLCFIPAFSILFFDKRLFYFSLIFNAVLITFTFGYVVLIDQGTNYSHITMDLMGNMINFIGSQVILYLIFYISSDRIKKQQLYYEELQQSEKLKTTGQLAAAVAHEIRNPLTVVKGFLQIYEHDPLMRMEAKKDFSLMIEELNTAEYVISQFLAIAKPDHDQKLETVDVQKLLRSVSELLMSYGMFHQNSIDLKVPGNIFISANHIELKQLFINLVKNAIEVSSKGDSVIIRAERIKDEIEIQIVDSGFGMSEEQVKSLGTPFYSLKSKGTGLGLMICFNIVEKYKGSIQFKSIEGEGTTVIVRFPSVE